MSKCLFILGYAALGMFDLYQTIMQFMDGHYVRGSILAVATLWVICIMVMYMVKALFNKD